MSKYRKELSQQEFEEIEKYLAGGMNTAEQTKFEYRMAADNVLKEEVMLQQKLIGTIESAAFITDKATRRPSSTPSPGQQTIRYWRYAAAVIIIVIAGLAGWWFYSSKNISRQDLYADYFRPDAGLPTMMSSDTILYTFNEGMILYKEELYERAIGVWENLIKQTGITDTLEYYIGVAWINIDSMSRSQPYLERISNNKTSVFQQKATWYLALIRIKQKDYNSARLLLRQLPGKKTAIELLDQLPQ